MNSHRLLGRMQHCGVIIVSRSLRDPSAHWYCQELHDAAGDAGCPQVSSIGLPYFLEQKPPASISTITPDPGLYSRPGSYYYIHIMTNWR